MFFETRREPRIANTKLEQKTRTDTAAAAALA